MNAVAAAAPVTALLPLRRFFEVVAILDDPDIPLPSVDDDDDYNRSARWCEMAIRSVNRCSSLRHHLQQY